jgi:hypothetical protein
MVANAAAVYLYVSLMRFFARVGLVCPLMGRGFVVCRYTISHFGDDRYARKQHWPFMVYLLGAGISAVICQTFLIMRVYRLYVLVSSFPSSLPSSLLPSLPPLERLSRCSLTHLCETDLVRLYLCACFCRLTLSHIQTCRPLPFVRPLTRLPFPSLTYSILVSSYRQFPPPTFAAELRSGSWQQPLSIFSLQSSLPWPCEKWRPLLMPRQSKLIVASVFSFPVQSDPSTLPYSIYQHHQDAQSKGNPIRKLHGCCCDAGVRDLSGLAWYQRRHTLSLSLSRLQTR